MVWVEGRSKGYEEGKEYKMRQQAVNPYLPLDEYVPDGEPRVFGDRLYIFGSHDRSHGRKFCMNDYVGWSAPCDNLADWRYEGVIYRKTDDPNNIEKEAMYAPDVVADRTGTIICFMVMEAKNSRKSGRFMWLCAVCRPEDINIMGRLTCQPGKKGTFLLILRFWWMMTSVFGCITDSDREIGGREIKGAAVQLWNWLQI